MKIEHLSLFFLLAFVVSTVASAQVNFPGGRIALSHDGNLHDHDDYGAIAMALAMLDAADLNNKVVHVDFANHMGCNNGTMENEMIESALGAAQRFGFDQSVFFNDQRQINAATNNFAAAINASSANDPLWILAAGPMETVWRGIKAAETNKRQFVKVISHGQWNDDHNHCQSNHTWRIMKTDFEDDGVSFIKIKDQNSSNGENDLNTPKNKWFWLKDSSNPDWKWLYSRNDKDTFDVSDAGMTYWLISGGPNGGCENCGWLETKGLLERETDNIPPDPPKNVKVTPEQ